MISFTKKKRPQSLKSTKHYQQKQEKKSINENSIEGSFCSQIHVLQNSMEIFKISEAVTNDHNISNQDARLFNQILSERNSIVLKNITNHNKKDLKIHLPKYLDGSKEIYYNADRFNNNLILMNGYQTEPAIKQSIKHPIILKSKNIIQTTNKPNLVRIDKKQQSFSNQKNTIVLKKCTTEREKWKHHEIKNKLGVEEQRLKNAEIQTDWNELLSEESRRLRNENAEYRLKLTSLCDAAQYHLQEKSKLKERICRMEVQLTALVEECEKAEQISVDQSEELSEMTKAATNLQSGDQQHSAERHPPYDQLIMVNKNIRNELELQKIKRINLENQIKILNQNYQIQFNRQQQNIQKKIQHMQYLLNTKCNEVKEKEDLINKYLVKSQ